MMPNGSRFTVTPEGGSYASSRPPQPLLSCRRTATPSRRRSCCTDGNEVGTLHADTELAVEVWRQGNPSVKRRLRAERARLERRRANRARLTRSTWSGPSAHAHSAICKLEREHVDVVRRRRLDVLHVLERKLQLRGHGFLLRVPSEPQAEQATVCCQIGCALDAAHHVVAVRERDYRAAED